MNTALTSYQEFRQSDIRIGKILSAEPNLKAKVPAHILSIDFGELGVKTTSAQITTRYPDPEELVGTMIAAVVNFPPKRIAGFKSEVLLLATVTPDGSVLLRPDFDVQPGCPVY